jgi:hypothetical protein
VESGVATTSGHRRSERRQRNLEDVVTVVVAS